MATSGRVGLAGLAITALSPAMSYFVNSWFLAALSAVVGVGLLLGWISARLHGRFAAEAAGLEPRQNDGR